MALIKSDNMAKNTEEDFSKNRRKAFSRQQQLLFENQIQHFKTTQSFLSLFDDSKSIYQCSIKNRGFVEYNQEKSLSKNADRPFFDCTFIQTPLVWDLYDFFHSIAVSKIQTDIEHLNKFNPKYPYVLWDIYAKLVNPRESNRNIRMINSSEKDYEWFLCERKLRKILFFKK